VWDNVYYHLVRADDPSRYDYTAKVVYVDISCSFTLSGDKTGIKGYQTVKEIIGSRKGAFGSDLPNMGKFIKESLGYALCNGERGGERVDATIFISTPIDGVAATQHVKNGSVLLNAGGDGLFDNFVGRDGSGIFEVMHHIGFFNQIFRTRNAGEVYGMLAGKLFLRYPPLKGGGRRRRRKHKTIRRSYRRRVRETRRRR